jgi:integrase
MMVGHPRRIVSGLEAVFVVLLMLGLRPGEALGLRWENIDVDAGASFESSNRSSSRTARC